MRFRSQSHSDVFKSPPSAPTLSLRSASEVKSVYLSSPLEVCPYIFAV